MAEKVGDAGEGQLAKTRRYWIQRTASGKGDGEHNSVDGDKLEVRKKDEMFCNLNQASFPISAARLP